MFELKNLKIFASYYYHNMGFNITHIVPNKNIQRDKPLGDPYPTHRRKNPFKSSTNDRTNYDIIRQSFHELESFDWDNALGIGTVASFNGLRALDFDGTTDLKLVEKILTVLDLPLNYEWVVKSGSQKGFHIIFCCGDFELAGYRRRLRRYFPNENHKSKFKSVDFIWFNHLILPPSLHKSGSHYRFEFVEYPLSHPAIVGKSQLRNLLYELCYQHGGFNIVKAEKENEVYYDIPIIDSPIILDKTEYDSFINSRNDSSNLAVKNQQVEYYKQNSESLENVYGKEQYKLGLSKIVETIKNEFGNLSVIEIACGSGYWTNYISTYAKEVLATDINEECLNIAKLKSQFKTTNFEIQDAMNLQVKKKYDAAFGGFIISHIEKEKLQEFFFSIHKAVKANGKIVLIDNTQSPNNNMEVDFIDPNGDTYQKRRTTDGEQYWIVKNFPDYNELKNILENIAYEIEYTKLKYFWILTYKVKK